MNVVISFTQHLQLSNFIHVKFCFHIRIADNQLAYEKALGTSGKYQRGNANLDLNLSIIDKIPVDITKRSPF